MPQRGIESGGHGFIRAANAHRIAALAAEVNMSPYDRTSFGSNVYFVTASTWGHRSLFETDRMPPLFIDTMFHYRRERKFLLHECVVMPTHFHLLLTPSGVTLERAMQFIQDGFSYRAKKELALNIEVWERGYIDHRIRDANDYARHVEYIRQNPVEAKIVVRAEDYVSSSASAGFEVDPCPLDREGMKLAR